LGRNGKVLADANSKSAMAFAKHIERSLPPGWPTMSYFEIARRLNEMGAKSPTGKQFQAQTVKNFASRLLGKRTGNIT
jgi:hypothetical protein